MWVCIGCVSVCLCVSYELYYISNYTSVCAGDAQALAGNLGVLTCGGVCPRVPMFQPPRSTVEVGSTRGLV